MKINNMLKQIALLGAFTFAVGCAGSADQPEAADTPDSQAEASTDNSAEATTAEPEAFSSGGSLSSYEVNQGDHLWGIAGNSSVYSNPYQWPLIYKANSDKIKDADLIYPGQNLDINTDPSNAETAAAVQHAKTRGSWSIGVTEESDTAYLEM